MVFLQNICTTIDAVIPMPVVVYSRSFLPGAHDIVLVQFCFGCINSRKLTLIQFFFYGDAY